MRKVLCDVVHSGDGAVCTSMFFVLHSYKVKRVGNNIAQFGATVNFLMHLWSLCIYRLNSISEIWIIMVDREG